jgi:hypothetical protein
MDIEAGDNVVEGGKDSTAVGGEAISTGGITGTAGIG